MHSLGLLSFPEPFVGRRNRGIILGEDGQKMSKSRGNVVDPDDLVKRFGADTVRLYLAFMAPYEQGGPWDPNGINGVHRFLKRLWAFVHEHATDTDEVSVEARRAVHLATKEVGEDLEHLRLNTTVSEMMKLLNALEPETSVSPTLLAQLVILLAPLAPHMAEELWSTTLGREGSVHEQAWPEYDEELLAQASVDLPVQVNGRVRGSITASRSDDQERLVELARREPSISRHIEGKQLEKVILVPGRMLNLIVR
jgi:leucyl-tRNA synthetase